MRLIIFDLDQTLVDFLPVHDEATRLLFRRFFDVDVRMTEIDFAGRSLTENFEELARIKNVPEQMFRDKKQQVLEAYEAAFAESLHREVATCVLPGARELLDALSKTDHVVALYTGNSAAIVDQVLQATGLGRCFRFLFYGTDVEKRSDMVKMAIARAQESTGQPFSDGDVVVIGDSVRDIESGKAYGARTIAVATGSHSRDDLLKAEPDYFFDSLREYRKVLSVIG